MHSTMSADPSVPIHELDVRPILAAGGAPIGAILGAINALPTGAALRLIAPFAPVPLYAKLDAMGFDHATSARADGAWDILFTPRRAAPPAPVLLDLRGLEPPEPLQRTVEALHDIGPGGVLIALTRFRPVHLLSVLDERGLAWETNEQVDGTWETIITNGPVS